MDTLSVTQITLVQAPSPLYSIKHFRKCSQAVFLTFFSLTPSAASQIILLKWFFPSSKILWLADISSGLSLFYWVLLGWKNLFLVEIYHGLPSYCRIKFVGMNIQLAKGNKLWWSVQDFDFFLWESSAKCWKPCFNKYDPRISQRFHSTKVPGTSRMDNHRNFMTHNFIFDFQVELWYNI